MLERTKISLAAARAEERTGTIGSGRWVDRNERLVIDLVTMLAVDENENLANGELVHVWPGNPQKEDADAAKALEVP